MIIHKSFLNVKQKFNILLKLLFCRQHMPSYYKRKLVKIGGSECVTIPKGWLANNRKNGSLLPTKTDKGEEWYIEMETNGDITIRAPHRSDISLSH
jgi:hypothetical protein